MSVKDEVLLALERSRGNVLSGGALAEKLGVTRSAVNKAVGVLRTEGLLIDAVPREGYRLAVDDDSLTVAGIQTLLKTEVIGHNMLVEPSLSSTNTVMKERYLCRLHGFTLIAEEQTGGRGRLGRSFASPAGTGIYMTILLHPSLPMDHVQFITLAAAVSVAEAIEETAGFEAQIKWVNDVLKEGRKLCGILTEADIESESGAVSSVVVGIGINLRPNPNWPDDVKNVAGALSDFGTVPRRAVLAAAVLSGFEQAYFQIVNGNEAALLERYRERLCCIGKKITVISASGQYEAECTGINEYGHLIVRDMNGTENTLFSGEISIRM